jgi:hypothetical protein
MLVIGEVALSLVLLVGEPEVLAKIKRIRRVSSKYGKFRVRRASRGMAPAAQGG